MEKHYSSNGISFLDTQFEDGTTPEEWLEAGFGPVSAIYWMQLGAFGFTQIWELEKVHEASKFDFLTAIAKRCCEAQIARPLNEEEIQLLQVSEELTCYTIPYLYCNGDLSMEQVKQLADK